MPEGPSLLVSGASTPAPIGHLISENKLVTHMAAAIEELAKSRVVSHVEESCPGRTADFLRPVIAVGRPAKSRGHSAALFVEEISWQSRGSAKDMLQRRPTVVPDEAVLRVHDLSQALLPVFLGLHVRRLERLGQSKFDFLSMTFGGPHLPVRLGRCIADEGPILTGPLEEVVADRRSCLISPDLVRPVVGLQPSVSVLRSPVRCAFRGEDCRGR